MVEIRTAISRRTIDPLLDETSRDPEMMVLASAHARALNPTEKLMQLGQQMNICFVNYVHYLWTSEVGVLFKLVLYFPPELLHIVRMYLLSVGTMDVRCTHSARQTIPPVARASDAPIVHSKLPFWKAVNKHILSNWCLPPSGYSEMICRHLIAARRIGWMIPHNFGPDDIQRASTCHGSRKLFPSFCRR